MTIRTWKLFLSLVFEKYFISYRYMSVSIITMPDRRSFLTDYYQSSFECYLISSFVLFNKTIDANKNQNTKNFSKRLKKLLNKTLSLVASERLLYCCAICSVIMNYQTLCRSQILWLLRYQNDTNKLVRYIIDIPNEKPTSLRSGIVKGKSRNKLETSKRTTALDTDSKATAMG